MMFLPFLLSLLGAFAVPSLRRTHSYDRFHPLEENGERGFLQGARPPGANPDLDCALREYAYTYAMSLQPERGTFRSVFDALQLAPLCNVTTPATEYGAADTWTRKSAFRSRMSDQTIYVDANKGSDTNSGSKSSPLQSLPAAVRLSRASEGTDTIILRAGFYSLSEKLVLTAIDNGLSITAYPGEQPIISSGQILTFNSWQAPNPTTQIRIYPNIDAVDGLVGAGQSSATIIYYGTTQDAATCSQACFKTAPCSGFTWHDSNQGIYALMCYLITDGSFQMTPEAGHTSGINVNVYSTSLSGQISQSFDQLFVNNKRQIRARHPNGDPETTGIHTNPTGYFGSARSWLPIRPYGGTYEFHLSSPSFPTNVNPYFPTFQAGVGGPVASFNPPFSYWGTASPAGGGGSTYVIPTGLTFNPATFPVNDWEDGTTSIVHAFHCGAWGNWQFQVDNYSNTTSTLEWSRGGFQEARGCKTGSNWYLENVAELVDAPGEWFFDNNTKILYYYPNSTDLPKTGIVPTLTNLITISGSKRNPVRNITLSGLTFAHTKQTFMEDYEVPSGGDWSVHRGGTVFIEGTENVVVENSLFQQLGGNGLFVSDHNRGLVISGNEFVWLGDGAIVQVGSPGLMNGYGADFPLGTHIIGNLVHEIGIWGKQVGAVYQSIAPETVIQGNVFFNGPRAGVNINDGFGGGQFLADNLMFNLVRETSDHGPINSWDRQPYYTWINTGSPSVYPKQNQVTRNFLYGNYGSAWAIDHDDGSAYYLDTYNVVIYGGAKNYLGHNKINRFNVYVNPETSVWGGMRCLNEYSTEIGEEYTSNICVSEALDGELYSLAECTTSDFTKIATLGNNSFWFPSGVGVKINCGSSDYTLAQWQAFGQDVGTTSNGPASIDQVISWIKAALNGP